MPYPDVNSALPWGGAANGQTQLPPGYNGASWLQYLASMFAPSSAEAGGVDAQGRPQSAIAAAQAALASGQPQPQPASLPVPPSVNGPQPRPEPAQGGPSWFQSGNNPMPWNGPSAPLPPPRPTDAPAASPANVAAPNAQPVAAQGPLALGGATGMSATSNPRFGTVQYQTPNSVGARSPIYTAMNLFGGSPQGNPSATPRAGVVPGASSPTRVAGPMAAATAPWNYGPYQKKVLGSGAQYGPDWRELGAGRSGYQ